MCHIWIWMSCHPRIKMSLFSNMRIWKSFLYSPHHQLQERERERERERYFFSSFQILINYFYVLSIIFQFPIFVIFLHHLKCPKHALSLMVKVHWLHHANTVLSPSVKLIIIFLVNFGHLLENNVLFFIFFNCQVSLSLSKFPNFFFF